MRVFYSALFLAAVLFASANSRVESKQHKLERRVRSLMFTGDPPSPRFDQKYTPELSVQSDNSRDQFPSQPEFSEYFDEWDKSGKDHQVNTNDVEQYPGGHQDKDQEVNDYGDSREDLHPLFSDYDHAEYQKILDMLKDLLKVKDTESQVDKKRSHDYDDHDDEDGDEGDDYDSDEHDGRFSTDDFAKGAPYPSGKDFEETSDVEDWPQGSEHQAQDDDGFGKNPKDYLPSRYPPVFETYDDYKDQSYGEDDIDEDFDSGFDSPRDKGQDRNQDTDASDEFADSDELNFDDQDSWKGQDKVQTKTPNQDVDGKVSQQQPDGRGVIEPRVGNVEPSSGRSYDFGPQVVQRWKRGDLASGRYQPSDRCVDICNVLKPGGNKSPRVRSLCNCNGNKVRHVKK